MICPLFRFKGRNVSNFFVGLLENLRHQKDIVKLTDIYAYTTFKRTNIKKVKESWHRFELKDQRLTQHKTEWPCSIVPILAKISKSYPLCSFLPY